MAATASDVGFDVHAYLLQHQRKSLLRLITCGSVDDGKSSLIGRLLYDAKLIYEDQLAAVSSDSARCGTTGERPDLALLMDGLQSEREQGITIDVAYRYFSTERRKFIIADTPGHEQYTRNMATGASTADLAIILVDARKGVLTQTRRHSYIVSLLGIRHVVLAVNKMDLVDYRKEVFRRIVEDYQAFARPLGFESLDCVPLSALLGDNIVEPGGRMPWYPGLPLLRLLEETSVDGHASDGPLRLPVQWVNRPHLNFRGYSGTLAGGSLRPGDEIAVLPSGQRSRVRSIISYDGELDEARSGDAVTLTLDDEIDISRGDLLVDPSRLPQVSDQLLAHLVWMHDQPMLPNRQYLLKIGALTLPARISRLHHRVDIEDLSRQPAGALQLNEIGYCRLSLEHSVAFDAYRDNRRTGGFILVDRLSNATVGAGMIEGTDLPADQLVPVELSVSKQQRAELKAQKPCVVWLTGLSGAGKSSIANALEQMLLNRGCHAYVLDANNLRHGINSDLGFSTADRIENLRRAGEIAGLFVDAGLVVIAAFISPYRQERQQVRARLQPEEFIEVFVDTPLEVCMQRDPNRLYARAQAGEITNFTGLDAPYERPQTAELVIDGAATGVEAAARRILDLLQQRELVN